MQRRHVPIAWLESMFFKKRTADSQAAPTTRKKRRKVHVSWGGVVTLDEKQLFEPEFGRRILREAEELEKRLRRKPSTGDVAPTASDRPPTGD